MDPLQDPLATTPSTCPICDSKGPFEHLRVGFTCPACFCWFSLNDTGELYQWGWTQKSADVIANLSRENRRLRSVMSAVTNDRDE